MVNPASKWFLALFDISRIPQQVWIGPHLVPDGPHLGATPWQGTIQTVICFWLWAMASEYEKSKKILCFTVLSVARISASACGSEGFCWGCVSNQEHFATRSQWCWCWVASRISRLRALLSHTWWVRVNKRCRLEENKLYCRNLFRRMFPGKSFQP